MSKVVILPFCDWMNVSRVAKANGCTESEVLEHAEELRKQGFGISVGQHKKHVDMRPRGARGVLRKPGQSEFPEYWFSKRHKEVWTNYVNITPGRVSTVSGLVTHEHL